MTASPQIAATPADALPGGPGPASTVQAATRPISRAAGAFAHRRYAPPDRLPGALAELAELHATPDCAECFRALVAGWLLQELPRRATTASCRHRGNQP